MKKRDNFWESLFYCGMCLTTLGVVWGMRIVITIAIRKAFENQVQEVNVEQAADESSK